jgi:hypothetical protein
LRSGELEALPGPGLDVPVDADGDGLSTHGDRYVFNYWLALGGDLASALNAAEVGKDGVIDLGKFFSSPDALLKPRVEVVEGEPTGASGGAGGAETLSSGCVTPARLVAPFGDLTPLPSLLGSCQTLLRHPTGADMDTPQGLWLSRSSVVEDQLGVAYFSLSEAPPLGQNGTIPLESPLITERDGFGSEAIVVREKPPYPPGSCGVGGVLLAQHAMTTWPTESLICRSNRNSSVLCGNIISEVGPNSMGLPKIQYPFAIDVVRQGMPAGFRDPSVPDEDAEKCLIFSDIVNNAQLIRRAVTEPYVPPQGTQTVSTVTTLAPIHPDYRVRGLALGDFKGTGIFAAYYVARPAFPPSSYIRRLVPLAGGGFADEHFVFVVDNGLVRSMKFDPVSGDLFVSEDRALNSSSGYARIWRINKDGIVRPFGERFNKPNGIAFHPSGVMLVAEETTATTPPTGNVVVVGGWRNLFKRGDANGSGIVDISDAIAISDWVTPPGAVPPCLDGADADDDSKVLQADADHILNFLFSGGPPPKPPFPNCGRDPTADLLDCTKSLGAGCAIQ